jgi:hypothetical protein
VARWLKHFLAPRNGLILNFDHLEGDSIDEFQSQVQAVSQYYPLVKISEVVKRLREHRKLGVAAIVFRNARKSVFLHAVPWLQARELPFTIFCRPDCIGLNRLPLEDELFLYRTHAPDRMNESLYREKLEEAWAQPRRVRQFLDERRKEWGPLPLDKMDPTFFFSTWKQLVELSAHYFEAGFFVEASLKNRADLEESLAFVRQQLSRDVRVAMTPREDSDLSAWLSTVKIEGLVTPRQGPLDKTCAPLELPLFPMEKADGGQ